jgi:YesN/AraC family two-component response regulator
MLKKMVVEFGHETIEAGNGREGLEKITSEEPDLVLTDILMPEMEGTELLELLRETNMDVNVIVISANIQWKHNSSSIFVMKKGGYDGTKIGC